jgi:hypothetical protein
MSSGSASVPIVASAMTVGTAGQSLTLSRLWVKLLFARRLGEPVFADCLLDSCAPLCVVPYRVHQVQGLAWQPLPGPWPPGLTTWSGVPCVMGTMDVWAPTRQAPFRRGPLTFVAKFALATPPQLTGVIPILLGLNFLADHRAEVDFQCHTIPNAGSIQLP